MLPFVLCLGVAAQKMGMLIYLQTALFASSSAANPGTMALLFFPGPLVFLTFLILPVRNPRAHLAAAFACLALLFALFPPGNPVTLLLIATIGAWMNISTQSSLAGNEEKFIRRMNSAMIVCVIIAQVAATFLLASNFKILPLLTLAAIAGAIISILPSTNKTASHPAIGGSLFAQIPSLLRKSAPLMIIFLTAGAAEGITLKKLSSFGMGSEAYGCLLVGSSISSIAGACTEPPANGWVKTVVLWHFAIFGLLLGGVVLFAGCYVLLGALGILITRELRTDILTTSDNPSAAVAASNLMLSASMVVGSVLGVLAVPMVH